MEFIAPNGLNEYMKHPINKLWAQYCYDIAKSIGKKDVIEYFASSGIAEVSCNISGHIRGREETDKMPDKRRKIHSDGLEILNVETYLKETGNKNDISHNAGI